MKIFNKLIPLFIIFVAVGIMAMLGLQFLSQVPPMDEDNSTPEQYANYQNATVVTTKFFYGFTILQMVIAVIMILSVIYFALKAARFFK